jgi:hypothetical protein
MSNEAFWRRCSTCKSSIGFTTTYWICNVSTCNRKKMELVFCEVSCWDAHVPLMRHRESWAEERQSPTAGDWQRHQAAMHETGPGARTPKRADKPKVETSRTPSTSPTVIRRKKSTGDETPNQASAPRQTPAIQSDEILIVASKLKAYVKAQSGFNTSDRVMAILSDRVRVMCDAAIRRARSEEQQTVMERDVD